MSVDEKCLKLIDIERIYEHVRLLEGIKHPFEHMKALSKGAEYIENEFNKNGLKTVRHYFEVKGYEGEFYNVEGFLPSVDYSDPNKPILFVTSHYDTVPQSPGADDNASAVAIMLETARILKELNFEGNVKFVSFSMEEMSPYIYKKSIELAQKHKTRDNQTRFTSLRLSNAYEKLYKMVFSSNPRKFYLDKPNWEKFVSEIAGKLNKNEMEYFRELNELLKEYEIEGNFGVLGSGKYAEKAFNEGVNIMGVLNLETVGYTSSNPNSQNFPPGITLAPFTKYKVDEKAMIGNFVSVLGDRNSNLLVTTFIESCKSKFVDLPCAGLAVPLGFNEIKNLMPDILRSDHSPFWQHNFPAVMITDTANFRNPHYHTSGDTIETLDFDFIEKVCKGTLLTILNLQKD